MLIQANPVTRSLWLLLLLHVSGIDPMKFNIFNKNVDPGLVTAPQDGDVRLSGSGRPSEGRVEVYHAGRWGTVCDDGWDLAEARVVCRQLRFPGAKAVVVGRDYGPAPGPIWLDDITCKGTERALTRCVFLNWGVTDCTHKEDVGVACETDADSDDNTTHSLDHSRDLSQDLGQMFDGGEGCDFHILVQSPGPGCGNQQADGTMEMAETAICTHKLILSQFPRFNVSQGIRNISVQVSQSCQPHFTSFIRYLYTRKMDVTFSSAQCFHWMASKFGLKQLMEDTGRLFTQILPEDVSFHTQTSLYEYAVENEDLALRENCLQYLAWNYPNLTQSPAWDDLPAELLAALLSRSDLVVPDEAFLLRSVDHWISKKGNLTSLEEQAQLLSHIRFPMISAETLYELEFTFALYHTHRDLFRDNMIKALQFNVLLFSNLTSKHTFSVEDNDYQPRIYTADPWSAVISANTSRSIRQFIGPRYQYRYDSYGYSNSYRTNPRVTFKTPVHYSMIFKDQLISWEADLFTRQSDCSNRGLRCESLPACMLTPQNSLQKYQSRVVFNNLLLVMCQGKHISQVQDFKVNMAYVPSNDTQALPYPCSDNSYTYRFVVRPKYI